MMLIPSIDWAVVAPLAVLLATGLLVLLADLLIPVAPRSLLYGIGVVGSLAAFAVSLPLAGRTLSTFGGAFASDAFSWPFDALLLLALVMTFLLSSLAHAEDGGNPGAYAALLPTAARRAVDGIAPTFRERRPTDRAGAGRHSPSKTQRSLRANRP